MCKVICAPYDLVVRRAFVVMVEVGVDERWWRASVNVNAGVWSAQLTCTLGRFDIGELDTIGLELGPVEATSLPVGDVASLRVRALHECRLALATRCGNAGYAERQRQSGQGDDL